MSDKPSVGRAVHYYPDHADPVFDADWPGPLAATITKVWDDKRVNLMVSPPWPRGEPYTIVSVTLHEVPGDVLPRRWVWPPRV